MNETELIGLLARRIEKVGSQAAWAKEHGISAPYVNDVLNFRRAPGAKILTALGLTRTVNYQKDRADG
jgi:DNA-binding transcriptional regulator YdaS (Cro superfamily)